MKKRLAVVAAALTALAGVAAGSALGADQQRLQDRTQDQIVLWLHDGSCK